MNTAPKLSIPSHVMARRVGDETVILDLNSGTYFGLDPVGARIWQGLTEGLSLPEVCASVVEEFEVTLETVQTDVQRLVEELMGRGLLVSSGA